MAKTTYLSCEENGEAGAQRIADMYRARGYTVNVEHGRIPQWGSGIPGSSNFGQTEPGWKIIVDDHRPDESPFIF